MSSPKKPTRATVAGSAYLDLRAAARNQGRPVDEFLTLYALEGFLDRLYRSGWASDFVLKGGVLLAAFGQRRPTRDVDLAAVDLDNDGAHVLRVLKDVASVRVDDGVSIDVEGATVEVIRDNSAGYSGARVSFRAAIATARVSFHVDVNVGDPISPEPTVVPLPRLLGGTLNVVGYPVEMVIAEKLLTVVERGVANTRWRDFVDLHRITRSRTVEGSVLMASCLEVAAFRGATLAPLGIVLDGFASIAQPRWAAWRSKQRLQTEAPELMVDLIDDLELFADPLLTERVAGLWWDHRQRVWR